MQATFRLLKNGASNCCREVISRRTMCAYARMNADTRKGVNRMPRTSIARDVYGAPRHETDGELRGRKTRARNLRVSKISDATWCSSCDRPSSVCPCERYANKRPKDRDSVMTSELYRRKKTRDMFYRSKGRLA